MSDDTKDVDIEIVKKMLKQINEVEFGPSISEMKSNPKFTSLFRDESETNPVKGQLMKAIKTLPPLTCVAPTNPPCGNKPIKSHSIRKSATLRLLADDSNHVLMFKAKPSFDSHPIAEPQPVGIHEATTSPSLCSPHDNEMFKEIDNGTFEAPSIRQLFLLSYRSVLREYFAKMSQEVAMKEQAKTVSEDAGASKEAKMVAVIIAYNTCVSGVHTGNIKRMYDHIFSNEEYEKDIRYTFRHVRKLPFAVAGFFTPVHDFEGKKIPKDGIRNPWPCMTLDIMPDETGTLISIAVPNQFKDDLQSLISHFKPEISDDDWINYAWELTLRNCENLVISPESWNRTNDETKKTVIDLFNKTIYNTWVPRPTNSIEIW